MTCFFMFLRRVTFAITACGCGSVMAPLVKSILRMNWKARFLGRSVIRIASSALLLRTTRSRGKMGQTLHQSFCVNGLRLPRNKLRIPGRPLPTSRTMGSISMKLRRCSTIRSRRRFRTRTIPASPRIPPSSKPCGLATGGTKSAARLSARGVRLRIGASRRRAWGRRSTPQKVGCYNNLECPTMS